MKKCTNLSCSHVFDNDQLMNCPVCGAPLTPVHDGVDYGPEPAIGLSDAVRICLKEKFATFKGRATRAEYWYFCLFQFLVVMVMEVISVALAMGAVVDYRSFWFGIIGCGVMLIWLFALVMIIPSLAVFVRRMHDAGHSGWCYFLGFIPIVGPIILLVFMCQESEAHDNEYGPYVRHL